MGREVTESKGKGNRRNEGRSRGDEEEVRERKKKE